MEKLAKAKDSDLKESELLLAKYLVQYYRHSFDVRAQGILNITIDPPEVRELVNMLQWVGGGFDLHDAGRHVLGLYDVIEFSSEEMNELLLYVRKHGVNELQAKEINFLQEQMEAADTLMEYITDG